jgi:hypothetical protein
MTALSTRDLTFAGLLAAALAAGLWTAWGWLQLPAGTFTPGLTGHGPDPFLWRRFLVVWLPLAHVLFALGYWALARGASDVSFRRHFLVDQGLVALVLPLLVALRVAGPAGPWRFVLATGYGVFVACKTAVFLHALWRWLTGRASLGLAPVAAVGLGALLPYVLLGGSVVTAVSSTGDEPYYLLTAHSLIHDGDADVSNNLERRDYLPFYWDRLASGQQPSFLGPIQDSLRQYSGLQPFLLVPGYWLGGRTGALATMAILSAAALALSFRLALATGAGLRAAYLAWLAAAFSAPIVSLATSSFVEMSAGFVLSAAASGALEMRRPWAKGLFVAGCLAALVALKNRLLLMGVPVLLSLAPRITLRHLAALGLSVLAAAVAAISYDAYVMGGVMGMYLRSGGPLGVAGWAPETLLGYLFDQEYGLLISAPAFSLGLVGAVVALRDRQYRLLLVTFGPFAATWILFGLGVGVTYGGTAPPARYLAASLPLLAALSALAYARVRGRLLWALVTSLLAATVLYAVTLSLWPAWRYQHGVGRNTVLTQLWEWVGLDLGRLLPSFLPPQPWWTAAVGMALLALLASGWWLAGQPGQAPPHGAVALGALVLAVVVGASVASVWWLPWGTLPAGGWQGRGGMVFRGWITVDAGEARAAPQMKAVWAAQRPAVVTIAPWLPPGRYRLVVRAGAMGPEGGPRLTVWVGDAVVQAVALASTPPPVWRSADYASEMTWSGGRLPVRLELGDVSSRDPIRVAYLEHLRLERLAP